MKVLKVLVESILIILIALLIGVGSVLLYFQIQMKTGLNVTNGPWNTSLLAGKEIAGMYLTAMGAVYGPLGLDPSETIYFIAIHDSKGEKLDYRCNYRIEGKDLPARWWNITVYRDYDWIPNDQNRWSFSKTNIKFDKDKRWTVKLSSTRQEGNWLPLGDKKGVLLLNLRFYNPELSAIKNLTTIELPTIIKEGCR
jgi:hypothetical protein